MIALWKMVGQHVNFGGNYGQFELFDQPEGGVRAVKDEPGFELDINPPLSPAHPYHTHIITDNPPSDSHAPRSRRGAAGRPVIWRSLMRRRRLSSCRPSCPLQRPMGDGLLTSPQTGKQDTRHSGRHTSIHQAYSLSFVLVSLGMLTEVCWTASSTSRPTSRLTDASPSWRAGVTACFPV